MLIQSGKFRTAAYLFMVSILFLSGCFSSEGSTQTPSPDTPMNEAPVLEENQEKPPASTSEEEPIVFEEPLVFSLLQKELGKTDILPSDLEPFKGITFAADEFIFLTGPDYPEKSIIHFNDDAFEYDGVRYEGDGTIKSLADLRHFPNLERLYITLQPDIDYSTLPEEILSRISTFFLYQSKVENISFLEKADNLWNLIVNTNSITDLSPLTGKTTLKRLNIDWNNVEDLTPVSTLTSLTYFSAYGNRISDLSPLSTLENLEDLRLYQNLIRDIRPLEGMKNLKRIEMVNNQIEDVSPLQNFDSFDSLALSGNPITNIEVLDHIDNLEYDPEY